MGNESLQILFFIKVIAIDDEEWSMQVFAQKMNGSGCAAQRLLDHITDGNVVPCWTNPFNNLLTQMIHHDKNFVDGTREGMHGMVDQRLSSNLNQWFGDLVGEGS